MYKLQLLHSQMFSALSRVKTDKQIFLLRLKVFSMTATDIKHHVYSSTLLHSAPVQWQAVLQLSNNSHTHTLILSPPPLHTNTQSSTEAPTTVPSILVIIII